MVFLDAGHIIRSGIVRYWIRPLDNTSDRLLDSIVGNLHGLNRTRPWFGGQCTAHSGASCYENVGLPFL